MVADGWLVEQVISGLLCLSMGGILALQIRSEQYSPTPIMGVKKFFHRVGIAIVLLDVPHAIDPYGVRGIFPHSRKTTVFLSYNVTGLLFTCICALTYYLVNALFGIRRGRGMVVKPTWLKWLLGGVAVVTQIGLNVAVALMFHKDEEWVRGVLYLFLATGLFVVSALASVGVALLRVELTAMINVPAPAKARVSGRRTATMEQSARRLLVLQIVGSLLCGLAISALAVRGVAKVRARRHHHPVEHVDGDTYTIHDCLLYWAQWVGLLLFMWWSWIPLYVLLPPDKLQEHRERLLGSGSSGRSLPNSRGRNSSADGRRKTRSRGSYHGRYKARSTASGSGSGSVTSNGSSSGDESGADKPLLDAPTIEHAHAVAINMPTPVREQTEYLVVGDPDRHDVPTESQSLFVGNTKVTDADIRAAAAVGGAPDLELRECARSMAASAPSDHKVLDPAE